MLSEGDYAGGWVCLPGASSRTTSAQSWPGEKYAETSAPTQAESFRNVFVSLLALTQVAAHCFAEGVETEVCGLLWGFVPPGAAAHVVVVCDATAIPGSAPEATTIPLPNVTTQANWPTHGLQLDIGERDRLCVVGWYRTHPGYGCWLNRVEQASQAAGQEVQEPWIAIIVDPLQSRRIGRVALRAFRVYPQGFQPPMQESGHNLFTSESIPLNFLDEYAREVSSCYELRVRYYGTEADASISAWIEQHDWPCVLSASNMATSRAFVAKSLEDLVGKTEAAEVAIRQLISARLHADKATESPSETTAGQESLLDIAQGPASFPDDERQMDDALDSRSTSGPMPSSSALGAKRHASSLPPLSPGVGRQMSQPRSSEMHSQKNTMISAAATNVSERMERLAADARALYADYARMLLREALKEALF
ncbi:COP9 signalosome complex subunit 5 [Cyanidiococcus yangmingshanensis]|uniref:COP9 signalosome complex subunit 5 n=1 Tax=Cyanidiococcus yangmingshanensis TaxID=2690220 RepID=A0A7J7IK57_9RHOD|nr:COP9 signalosome complex subunit 5 [Cyanidiococcus yangmingshanensis]